MDTININGQGEPWQAAPRRESEFFDEEFATQYTDYDPQKANEYLDEAGYARGADGGRLGPDGNPIRFLIETAGSTTTGADRLAALELIQGYWGEVGIEAEVRMVSRSLLFERVAANKHDGFSWEGDGGMNVIIVDAWYWPTPRWGWSFAPEWAWWYESGGERGSAPPEQVQEQMELWDLIQVTPDRDERVQLMRQILSITKDYFPVMGTVSSSQGYGIVKELVPQCAGSNHRPVLAPVSDRHLSVLHRVSAALFLEPARERVTPFGER